jgi:serine protease inhibitor
MLKWKAIAVINILMVVWFSGADGRPKKSEALVEQATSGDVGRLLREQSELSSLILGKMGNVAGENIVISPASLVMALAVIDLGADSVLKVAIRNTLQIDRGMPNNNKSRPGRLQQVRNALNKLRSDKTLSDVFTTVDALVIDPSSGPDRRVLERVAKTGTRIFSEPLQTPGLLAQINDWFSAKTRGLVPSILERVPAPNDLVVLNALYFKDGWRDQFEITRTREAPFQLLDGSSLNVAMMAGRMERVRVRSQQSFVAVDLPYAHDRFSLVVVTTRDVPAAASRFASVESWLTGEGFGENTVDVFLPRLELSNGTELLETLDALGLEGGRVSPTALKGFSGQPLRISQIVQKTYLKLDESGTEAAATTSIAVTRSASEPSVESIIFDKPFAFAIRDRITGLILVAGYVGQPRQDQATIDRDLVPKER